MRKILFRGKRKDDGEWIYGDLVCGDMICGNLTDVEDALGTYCNEVPYVGFVDVIPETVGQYTGLTDKDGKKIFEGDIIAEYNVIRSKEVDRYLTVEFHVDRGGWYPFATGDGCGCCEDVMLTPCDDGHVIRVEVVGNIHDNPELAEDKNDAN